jgi:hypothetical protein
MPRIRRCSPPPRDAGAALLVAAAEAPGEHGPLPCLPGSLGAPNVLPVGFDWDIARDQALARWPADRQRLSAPDRGHAAAPQPLWHQLCRGAGQRLCRARGCRLICGAPQALLAALG